MAIIAISGKAQAGKDTVGGHLNRILSGKSFTDGVGWMQTTNYQYPYEIKKFAQKLKDSIEFKFPSFFSTKLWEENPSNGFGGYYRDVEIASLNMTRRELLIAEAMALRAINPDYWVVALFNEYNKQTLQWDRKGSSTRDGYPNWIITDLRFPNEFEAIKKIGGTCIRVERPDIPLIDSISETSLDKGFEFDAVINNNSDEVSLIKKIEFVYESIK